MSSDQGSPAKAKRIFASEEGEGMPVSKARRVAKEEPLQKDTRRLRMVLDDRECSMALIRIGVCAPVLVSEALGMLGELVDFYFQGMSGMDKYKKDTEIILSSVTSCQGNGSFSRFARGLFTGCKQDGPVYDAITRSGMELFWKVLQMAAAGNPENDSLQKMSKCDREEEFAVLAAWNEMFDLLEERQRNTSCFNLITNLLAGDMYVAEDAVEVLDFLGEDRYKDKRQSVLINASVPILMKKMSEEKIRRKIKEDFIRSRIPHPPRRRRPSD